MSESILAKVMAHSYKTRQENLVSDTIAPNKTLMRVARGDYHRF